jgi:hypothetical protein
MSEFTLDTAIYVVMNGEIIETTPRKTMSDWAEHTTSPRGNEPQLHIDGLRLCRYMPNGHRHAIQTYDTEADAEKALDEMLCDYFTESGKTENRLNWHFTKEDAEEASLHAIHDALNKRLRVIYERDFTKYELNQIINALENAAVKEEKHRHELINNEALNTENKEFTLDCINNATKKIKCLKELIHNFRDFSSHGKPNEKSLMACSRTKTQC